MQYTLGQKAIYLLRHQRQKPIVDDNGWTTIQSLYAELTKLGYKTTLEDLTQNLIKSKRAELKDKDKYVRATHGHSNGVIIPRINQNPPKYLYHGTAYVKRFWVKAKGLKVKDKLIHLTADIELANTYANSGGRKPIVYRIDARRMFNEGYEFYLSSNSVWLTECVPKDYLEVAG